VRVRAATLAAFALIFSVVQVAAYTQKSATFDEPIHLATGYLALAHQDYRLEGTHPPFIRMWAALPLLFIRDVQIDASIIDRTEPVEWMSGSNSFNFSTKFLYIDNDADRLLNAARFMIVIWGVVLGVLVWCWAYEWLDAGPALWALVFYTLSPNLLANTSLVTTDGGITCFMFGTVYFLWRTTRRVTWANLAGLTVFFALGVVSKFSALAFGPLVVVLLIVAVVRRSAVTWKTAVGIVALLAVVSYVAVWAVYGFRYTPGPSPSWQLHVEHLPLARTVPTLASTTAWIDRHHLLPNSFTQGFLVFAQSMVPPNWTFLAGDYSTDGWWYYFPAAFLIKTPVAFIALIAIGSVVCVRRPREPRPTAETFIAVSVAIYLALAISNTFQVGVRHILPLYPFFVLVAAAATTMLTRNLSGRFTLAGLLAVWFVMLASTYPHTLTFFNLFVGGPANGYKYLADSNVDWGQGLKLLKQWMEREGVPRVGLAYFGTADPAYHGIDYSLLPAATPGYDFPGTMRPWAAPALPGYVAVSATVLTGVYLDPEWRLFYEGLRQMEPIERLGNSIFVYRLERWPERTVRQNEATVTPDADLRLADALAKAQWFDHAVVHYRRHIQAAPDDAAALTRLGMALVAGDEPLEAIPVLEGAIAREPENGLAHLFIAAALFDARRSIDTVIAHARRAALIRPADAGALVMLGRALAAGGQLDAAAVSVDRALAIGPDNADARELRRRIGLALAGTAPGAARP
jgi:4-amino-4-deoxy-L-arabinose transferase-like glycosyltransferase